MTVQERILELMEKKGWTKYKLAQETGLYQTTVYDLIGLTKRDIRQIENPLNLFAQL